ncbi:hypothetical protein [Nostoc sp. MG11]|uniref:hypothetical protein n=1 Tax=Nostoc sp. MG11 TaxID=2721166 RepID=UPI0018664CE8|nr:hypothetical protein [Nostoc sp. MG11]
MSDNPSEDPIIENVEPPEVKLTAHALSKTESTWLVVAKNHRVNQDWEALMQRHPENSRRCYDDLCTAPITRLPSCVFSLKGKLYKGAWEYEVTKGDRVFYVPHEEQLKVIVYYAGKHLKPAPTP